MQNFGWMPDGNNPAPMTMIHHQDVVEGNWMVNPGIAPNLTGKDLRRSAGLRPALHPRAGSAGQVSPHHLALPLYAWGALAMPLVSSVEEACFVHNMARRSQTRFEVKGGNPLTENYSVLSPEVLKDEGGSAIAAKKRVLHQHPAQLRQHHHRWSGQKPLRRLGRFLTCSPKFRLVILTWPRRFTC